MSRISALLLLLAPSLALAQSIPVFEWHGVAANGTAVSNGEDVATAIGTKVDLPQLREYGALCDGNPHPLSGSYRTLASAQAVYPSAVALSDEIDGLAFQTVYDKTPGSVVFQVPAGSCLFSRRLLTGSKALTIQGLGRDQSSLMFLNSGDGVDFGSPAAPSAQTLNIRHVSIVTSSSASGTAVAAVMTNGANVYSWTMLDVYFKGTVAGWRNPVTGMNMPRGLSFRDVVAFGTNNTTEPNSAFQFSATQGSFDYFLENCISVNYQYGYEFDEPATGDSGIEGVVLRGVQAFAGYGLVNIINTNSLYYPISFIIEDADWQGYGPAIKAQHVMNLSVSGGVYVLSPLVVGVSAIYSPAAEIDIIDFEGIVDSSIDHASFLDLPDDKNFSFIRVDGVSSAIRLTDNSFHDFRGHPNSGIRMEMNASTNTIRETGSNFRVWGSSGKINDVGGNQISQTAFDSIGAIQSATGLISLGGRTGPLATNSSGQISYKFPTRPLTEKPAFLQAPVVLLTNIISSAAIATSAAISINATGFTLQVPGAGAGIMVQVDYFATGR